MPKYQFRVNYDYIRHVGHIGDLGHMDNTCYTENKTIERSNNEKTITSSLMKYELKTETNMDTNTCDVKLTHSHCSNVQVKNILIDLKYNDDINNIIDENGNVIDDYLFLFETITENAERRKCAEHNKTSIDLIPISAYLLNHKKYKKYNKCKKYKKYLSNKWCVVIFFLIFQLSLVYSNFL